MATGLLRLAAAVLAGVGLTVLVMHGPALALSCAGHPDGSPQAIAQRREVLAGERGFAEQFDGAILGEVRAVDTNSNGASAQYGRTQVTVEVAATFGPRVPNPAVIVEPDPGWLAGYRYETGRHYFIPYTHNTDEFSSQLCDPISKIDAGDIGELVQRADDAGWTTTADYGPMADTNPQWLWIALAGTAVVAAGALWIVVQAGD